MNKKISAIILAGFIILLFPLSMTIAASGPAADLMIDDYERATIDKVPSDSPLINISVRHETFADGILTITHTLTDQRPAQYYTGVEIPANNTYKYLIMRVKGRDGGEETQMSLSNNSDPASSTNPQLISNLKSPSGSIKITKNWQYIAVDIEKSGLCYTTSGVYTSFFLAFTFEKATKNTEISFDELYLSNDEINASTTTKTTISTAITSANTTQAITPTATTTKSTTTTKATTTTTKSTTTTTKATTTTQPTTSPKKVISACTATLSTASYTYDGKAKTPAVTVKNGTVTLKKDTDYTVSYSANTNAGTATAKITSKGNYSGTKSLTFKINAKSVSVLTATLSTASYTYDGKTKTPAVTVKNGTVTLKKDADYTVSYSANTNAGTATAKITGKGNYSGTKSLTFKINKKSVSRLTATLSTASYKYDGKGKTPAVTVKNESTTLKKDTHYTISYTNNKNIGTATVKITGKGNYSGTKSITYKIVPATIGISSVTSSKAKELKVTWKKDNNVTGYEVNVALNNKFTSSNKTYTITSKTTVTKTITGLTSKKTYYVRVRSYKTVNGTKVYSAWSTVKTIKIK